MLGYLQYSEGQTEVATFEYSEDFLKTQIEPSPLKLSTQEKVFAFDAISRRTFHGLPGFIADALPDKFGNQLIDLYFAEQGFSSKDITFLDLFCYSF